MVVQHLKKSSSLCRCLPVGILCVLSMIAFNSARAAQEEAVPGNSGGQQSDTVRPRLVHDGSLKVRHYPLDIKTYRGIGDSQDDSLRIDRNTPYFHEPLIYFRKDEDGHLKNKYEGGILTLYVAMNLLEHQTLQSVKTYLQKKKGVSKGDLPLDANIQPLSVRGWFESSAYEEIRSLLWDVTMSSRSGPDFSVHFPISSRDDADRFLSRLHHGNGETLFFKYSLRGDAIEVCTVNASAEAMTSQRRFQDLAGDASGDGRYVSRDQVAELMSDIVRHESISSNCRTESVATKLRDEALKRLDDKVERGFTVDHLDRLTNDVQDDIRADIDNSSTRIQAREEREQIQYLSQQVRSGAMGIGLFLQAIVELIPFAAEATVDVSHASGEAYQFMWDSLSRVHDQLEWTGTRYRPKSVDVYRKEHLRNALNTSIQVRQETPVFAEDVRSIPISKENWIADEEGQPSAVSPLEALSARLVETEARLATAQEMIAALVARLEAPRLGNASRSDRSEVRLNGADLRIEAMADRNLRDERGRASGGDVKISADAVTELIYDDSGVPETAVYGGDVDIRADSDIHLYARDDLKLSARGYRSKEESREWRGGDMKLAARRDIEISSEAGRLRIRKDRSGNHIMELRSGRIEINGVAVELDADRIEVNGQSLIDYIRERL